ncbi:uncharacterized protein PFL1_04917 [Pseudozyma flocculosa PF-1]|uniref:GST N-terminal domain-containing protein n=2 Tax=Pseudozyma flocculosa TaxID=84751 RepID=A0A5C3EXU0_9BASI|nr:uncharacterized protein PFL1_04917 [Pseudozyma flocculosa PF-1]EPQ27378.1 hypothetical protein PFL1_04917 [Pseudozyma flocculosa PF-1]SPO36207.1 uncharacterized protein PSFLO_01678 [Pseudozyma flocculosa]
MEPEQIAKRSGSTADTDDASTAPATSAAASASGRESDIESSLDAGGDDDTGDNDDDNDNDDGMSESVASSNVRSTQQAVAQASQPGPARTASTPAGPHPERSLNGASDNLVLFDLTTRPEATLTFSPHTIKTILDLKLLGVGYERNRLTFTQIRGQLAQRIAENVTVPALELADGTHIMESWAIAEYLERNHPSGHRLFGNSATKRLAALLNDFGKSILAPSLGPLVMPGVHRLLDAESAEYFSQVKIGAARWNKISTLSAPEREALVHNVVSKLAVVETMLNSEGAGSFESVQAGNAAAAGGATSRTGNDLVGDFAPLSVRPKRSRWVAGGEEPSHADFVLFGWYVFSRAAGAAVVRDIWSPHKAIKAWVDDMLQWCGDLADDFVPLS